MHKLSKDFIDFILGNPGISDKTTAINLAGQRFGLIRERSVYYCDGFAVRFCFTKKKTDSFSNTVLSLSTLRHFDHIPFFVVLIKADSDTDNLILLANTTFLSKISHSSHLLASDHICGSFNGSDIMRECYGMRNEPANFSSLFAIHEGYDAADNLLRLIDATSAIKPAKTKFTPTESQRKIIFDSPERAARFIASNDFHKLSLDLDNRCNQCKDAIFAASHIPNVNIRGRLIEALITADHSTRTQLLANLKELETNLPAYDVKNGLADYVCRFDTATAYTDIKTKIVYLGSNPKAYNIDKFLQLMAEDRSVFLFFFVGIDENANFHTRLCSVYHSGLIDATITQHHWAGRSSRGVTQFNGNAINELLNAADFTNCIDLTQSREMLTKYMER